MKTTAIIPVKRIQDAKQRLAGLLDPAGRAGLMEAMFLDTLSSIHRSRQINEVLVVTSDDNVARQARWLGTTVIEQPTDAGQSRAAQAGVERAQHDGVERVALLPADCPLLDPAELDSHMGVVPRSALIVPDRHGTGTNGLILSPPDVIAPAFGPDSCGRHVSQARAADISFAVDHIPSLALDVDEPDDLVELREALILDPARAPRTAELVWELDLENRSTETASA